LHGVTAARMMRYLDWSRERVVRKTRWKRKFISEMEAPSL
jgi:hypothetical protein